VQKRDLEICTLAIVLLATAGETTTAAVTCAGHPPPLLVRAGQVRPFGPAGPIAGAWDHSRWQAETLELASGDVLVLYTDGVTDAQGEDGRFGDDRLAATVRDAGDADAAVGAIREALEAFERGAQADDTAVVAVTRVATGAPEDRDEPDDDAVRDDAERAVRP
jgi:serine phosphatase RsbU (regulator of sigma subunit)